MAMPRSVMTTSMSSPGPVTVVTSSTITGIRLRNDGSARIVQPEYRQFCRPPMPCKSMPSELFCYRRNEYVADVMETGTGAGSER